MKRKYKKKHSGISPAKLKRLRAIRGFIDSLLKK